LTRFKLLALALCLALGAAFVVAGCGGDDEDPEDVLRETFSGDHTVNSGTIDMSVSGSVEGATGGNFDASVSGPFQSTEGEFPQFDLTVSATGEGAGQSLDFEGGLTSTGDAMYVNYNGTDYEVDEATFKQIQQNYETSQAETEETGSFQEQCQTAAEQGGVDPSLCDIDPFSLVTNLENEGEEDVEGAETVHVHGDINIEEIGNLAGEAIAASPQAAFLPPEAIDQATAQVEEAVDEASFDVYSGKDDNILRRFDLNLGVTAPDDAAVAVPIEGADATLSIILGAVNEPQTIEAPANPEPFDGLLDELQESGIPLGGLPAVPGTGLPNTGGGGGGNFDFDGPGGVSPDGGGGGGGGGGAAVPDDAYLDCVANATTPEEIAECVEQSQ
jgi:hypothetical protein